MGESSSGALKTVGKYCYDPTKAIGSGAFGSIHPGWEKNDVHKKVVVKIPKEAREQDARVQEAKCQRKLKDHENIVTLYSYYQCAEGDDEAQLILVLEYCNGGNLRDFIEKKGGRGRLRQKVITKYLLPQLKAGYKAMYDKNIVHRDIKLENIFLSHPEDVENPDSDEITFKYGDFGFARCVDGHEVARATCGTPRYYAPEILSALKNPGSGRLQYRHKPDMWAIGKSSSC